jgi:hypothetical protein
LFIKWHVADAAISQIDGRIEATAIAAGQALERADLALGTVGEGRTITDRAVQAMNRVSDSAKGIDGVIEGLGKIALQTRVLAMDAAVEAGRAGERAAVSPSSPISSRRWRCASKRRPGEPATSSPPPRPTSSRRWRW